MEEGVKGKPYASRKKAAARPRGDFYETPRSLVWVASDIIAAEFSREVPILEPCSGHGAISEELTTLGYTLVENDLFTAPGGKDYLGDDSFLAYSQVVTNPPFSEWDKFINRAKSHAAKVMMIGRMNYLGTHSRLASGLWERLKAIYVFDRYVDYRTAPRIDGRFHVGALCTGWFLFDMAHEGRATIEVLDVQGFAKLGAYKVEKWRKA